MDTSVSDTELPDTFQSPPRRRRSTFFIGTSWLHTLSHGGASMLSTKLQTNSAEQSIRRLRAVQGVEYSIYQCMMDCS